MKILIRNVDDVVVYARPDLELNDVEATGDGWRDPRFSTANARIEEADLPDGWAGSVWAYVGGTWSIFDQVRHAAILAENQAAQAAHTLAGYDRALTDHLDAVATTRHYDNRINCALRAGYPGPYQSEGIAFAQWMDACNQIGYAMLNDFMAGSIPQPTIAEMLAALPEIVWP